MTALMWAAANGAVDCVRTLLKWGAVLSVTDKEGNAAVDWAMEQPEGSPHHIPQGRSGNFLAPLSLPHPHCDPYRRMIAHPAVLERMEWMLGSGFVHCEYYYLALQQQCAALNR